MESVMIKDIMGEQYETADNALYHQVQKQVVDYLNMSTGIQTILHMELLVQMVDDYNIIPKDKIISKNNLKGNELEVFGDGPFEIKKCIRFNGIAIGVAINEIRRYGLNQKKRIRFIKVGAQIISPNYSQLNNLTNLLFNNYK